MRLYVAVLGMAWADERDLQGEALALERRLPHIVAELEEVAKRDPWWVEPRQDLADYDLLQGRLADVVARYREMCALRPTDPRMQAMLGYFLLRAGAAADAEAAFERARRLPKAPAAATINLGAIRFSEGRDAEARALWRAALKQEPKNPIALMNLERPAASSNQEIDIRYLAQVPADARLARLLNRLAKRGKGYSAAERLRRVIEASLAQADWIEPQLNLVDLYSREGPQRDPGRALWHARRAVAIARESQRRSDLPDSLLALGQALVLNGKSDEALQALEEGRSKAPAAMLPEFDALLSTLHPPRP
jgi:tetratricopeptide (TPR) repeat protein